MKKDDAQVDLLSLLSPGRRQEILAEALHGQVGVLLSKHPNATLGEFVESLTQHEYWDHLKEIRAASVIAPREREAPARKKRAGRLDDALVDRVLDHIRNHPNQVSEQIQSALKHEDSHEVQRASCGRAPRARAEQ
jgi:hypothetical protein